MFKNPKVCMLPEQLPRQRLHLVVDRGDCWQLEAQLRFPPGSSIKISVGFRVEMFA